MRPAGGSAWTQTLTAALDLLGVQDKAARQTITRLHDRGWLTRAKVGRQTRWSLTPTAEQLLADGAERIYGFGQRHVTWDGSWSVILASVPDAARNRRHQVSVGLTWAGYGSLGQGTWISPWADREPEAVAVLNANGVEGATSFRAELTALGDAADLVTRAWDLTEVRAAYDAFNAALDPTVGGGGTGRDGADVVAPLVSLVHEWRRFPLLDPDLPTRLLPADWPGPEAAAAFANRRRQWNPAALRWWRATDASYGSA